MVAPMGVVVAFHMRKACGTDGAGCNQHGKEQCQYDQNDQQNFAEFFHMLPPETAAGKMPSGIGEEEGRKPSLCPLILNAIYYTIFLGKFNVFFQSFGTFCHKNKNLKNLPDLSRIKG